MGVIRAAGCKIFEAADDTCDNLTVAFEEPAAAPAGTTERRLQSSTFLIIYSMTFPAEEADRKAAVFESMTPESVFAVIEQELVDQDIPMNGLFVHSVCTTEECAELSDDDSDEEDDDEIVTPEPGTPTSANETSTVEPETEVSDANATTPAPDSPTPAPAPDLVDFQSTDDDEPAADTNDTTNDDDVLEETAGARPIANQRVGVAAFFMLSAVVVTPA